MDFFFFFFFVTKGQKSVFYKMLVFYEHSVVKQEPFHYTDDLVLGQIVNSNNNNQDWVKIRKIRTLY